MAEQLAAASVPLPFTDFHGGLNTRDQPYLLTQNQSRDLDNLQGTAAGALVKRNGFSTFASPAHALTSLYAFESETTPFLIGAGSTFLYSIGADGTVTQIKSGLTSGVRWEFVTSNVKDSQGPVFGMNGTDTPQQWDGDDASTTDWTYDSGTGSVHVPNGTMMVYNQNQIFVAGTASVPTGLSGPTDASSTVYWSAIGDPTCWDPASLTGAGYMEFDPGDGEPITGLGVVGPYILVGKPRKLWVIISVAKATARQISNNIGISAQRSIAVGPEGTYFLSEDRGVYVTNGTKLTPISDIITPTTRNITAGYRSRAVATYFDAHYYLSVPLNGNANDTILDYDAQLGSWWKHTIASNQFAIWHPTGPNSAATLYSAKPGTAIVDHAFDLSAWQDNGSDFEWVYRGPWLSPILYRHKWYETPYYRKRLRQLRIDGYGTVDVSISWDFAGAETLVEADVLAASAGGTFGASDGTYFGGDDGSLFGAPSVQRARIFSLGVGNAFSIVLSGTDGNPAAITSYITMVVGRRDLVFS